MRRNYGCLRLTIGLIATGVFIWLLLTSCKSMALINTTGGAGLRGNPYRSYVYPKAHVAHQNSRYKHFKNKR
jgi:hypothetical protein